MRAKWSAENPFRGPSARARSFHGPPDGTYAGILLGLFEAANWPAPLRLTPSVSRPGSPGGPNRDGRMGRGVIPDTGLARVGGWHGLPPRSGPTTRSSS